MHNQQEKVAKRDARGDKKRLFWFYLTGFIGYLMLMQNPNFKMYMFIKSAVLFNCKWIIVM
jgi:hypothetical protein